VPVQPREAKDNVGLRRRGLGELVLPTVGTNPPPDRPSAVQVVSIDFALHKKKHMYEYPPFN
jgi:hypothetical protein